MLLRVDAVSRSAESPKDLRIWWVGVRVNVGVSNNGSVRQGLGFRFCESHEGGWVGGVEWVVALSALMKNARESSNLNMSECTTPKWWRAMAQPASGPDPCSAASFSRILST